MRYVIAVTALMLFGSAAYSADIVTMPTANQLKAGQLDVAAYYLMLDFPAPQPQNVKYGTLYYGVTDAIELDAHWADVDNDKSSLVLVGSYKVLSETLKLPDLVVGVRNLAGTETTNNPAISDDSGDRSFFVSAAKTYFVGEQMGAPPLVRVHLSFGTGDWTLLGEERHKGFFGGLQSLITPKVGAIGLYDGQDLITGITYMPPNSGLTVKGGTYGKHQWIGVAYAKQL